MSQQGADAELPDSTEVYGARHRERKRDAIYYTIGKYIS